MQGWVDLGGWLERWFTRITDCKLLYSLNTWPGFVITLSSLLDIVLTSARTLPLSAFWADFKPDASDGRQQVSTAACTDARRHGRNAQEVFRSVEITNWQRGLDSEIQYSVSVLLVVLAVNAVDCLWYYVIDIHRCICYSEGLYGA